MGIKQIRYDKQRISNAEIINYYKEKITDGKMVRF